MLLVKPGRLNTSAFISAPSNTKSCQRVTWQKAARTREQKGGYQTPDVKQTFQKMRCGCISSSQFHRAKE